MDFNARVVLTVMYFVVVGPFGLAARWFSDPLALRRPPETRNPEAGLPPTEGPAPGDRVTQDGQPGGFLPPPPQS